MQFDASDHKKRGIHYLETQQYEKALKYFSLATNANPEDPDPYLFIALILSEGGCYEEAICLLEHVKTVVDPDRYDCYFRIGVNAIHMGDLEMAEINLATYLYLESGGEFEEEARSLIDRIAEELGHSIWDELEPYPSAYGVLCMEAEHFIEAGYFHRAQGILEELISIYDDAVDECNDLTLVYYYLGKMDEAIHCARQALEMEPSNLHAMCHLAMLLHQNGGQEEAKEIIQVLKKTVPVQAECLYKLGVTMGLLGEHEIAHQMFERKIRCADSCKLTCYHCMGVALYHMDNPSMAAQNWRKAQEVDPGLYAHDGLWSEIGKWLSDPSSSFLDKGMLVYPAFFDHDEVRDKPQELSKEWLSNPDDPVSLYCIGIMEADKPDRIKTLATLMMGLWSQFICSRGKHIRARRPQDWAAALEYVVVNEFGDGKKGISKKKAAKKHKASLVNMKRNIDRLMAWVYLHEQSSEKNL